MIGEITTMRSSSMLLLVFLLALPAIAQQGATPAIVHDPLPCLKADRKPLLEARLNTEGTPRVYFRERAAENWCFVDGERVLDKAVLILPDMPDGIEVEYFFVTYIEDRITGRSPLVYRARVQKECEVPVARHTGVVLLDCEGNNAIGVGMGNTFVSQDVEVSPSDQ
ncbi:MAG TPA: hypothetical protein VM534_03985 [Thermoanaerobaculia bacterium]|nr:hypothetical protein [Thermoanaerobaculia bacterium]